MPGIYLSSTPLTVADLAVRVKRIFGDESGAQITDADILRWVNDAQLDIARQTHCLSKSQTFSLTLGQYLIPPPVGFLFLTRAICRGRLLSPTNLNWLDLTFPNRQVSYPSGVPEYIIWKGNGFELYPAIDANALNGLVIEYTAYPSILTLVTEVLEIPEQYYLAVERFALMRAKELDQDWGAAQLFLKEYETMVRGIFHDENNRQENSYPAVRDVEDYF